MEKHNNLHQNIVLRILIPTIPGVAYIVLFGKLVIDKKVYEKWKFYLSKIIFDFSNRDFILISEYLEITNFSEPDTVKTIKTLTRIEINTSEIKTKGAMNQRFEVESSEFVGQGNNSLILYKLKHEAGIIRLSTFRNLEFIEPSGKERASFKEIKVLN